MGKNRFWLGLVVGLSGAGLMGWALFSMFTSSGCVRVGPGEYACGGSSLVNLALFAGILLNVVGMFLGGGIICFSALFMAIGLSALVPTFLGMMPGMETFGWLFGGMFFVCGLLPLLGGVALGRMGANKQAMAGQLMAGGTKAVGTIVEVSDTGVTINDNPRVMVRMRVAPLDGSPPVERRKIVTVSRVAIPRAGERFPVWFDRADPEKWMWGTDMEAGAPAAVKEMFARARGPSTSLGTGGAAEDDGGDSPVEALAQLTELWKDGALTDAEFAEAKARLLPRIGR